MYNHVRYARYDEANSFRYYEAVAPDIMRPVPQVTIKLVPPGIMRPILGIMRPVSFY